MLEKVLGPGDAEEEMVNAFHISLKRNDLWLLHETEWVNNKVWDMWHMYTPQVYTFSKVLSNQSFSS